MGNHAHPQLVKTRAGPPHRRFQRVQEQPEVPYVVPDSPTDPGAIEVEDPGTPLNPDGYPQGFPEEHDPVVWLNLPGLDPWMLVGLMHSDQDCPSVLVVPKYSQATVPPGAFIALSEAVQAVTQYVRCEQCSGARGEVAHRLAG